MAEPYDTWAADLIAALGVTGADAEAVAAVLQSATPTELEALSNLLTVRARIGPLLLTDGAPPNSLGAPGSFAIDVDAKVFYGPKDAVTGWPEGEAFLEGPQGAPGVDGEEVSLRVDSGFIQWRLGTGSWTNLIAVADLVGPQGDAGEEVSLRVDSGQIQWRLGTGAWTNLIAIADLKGDTGDTGDKGWSPELAAVTDGARRVHQVVDWVGGEGTKPTTGLYVGATGLVVDIEDAVDMRGAAGLNGEGTGDVIAPATHPAGYLPLWAGADSNTLTAGRPIGADADTDILDKAAGASLFRTEAQVSAAISTAIDGLVGGAPGALDTLNELAAALGDDADFAASVTTALAGKLSKTVSATGRVLGRVSSGAGDVEELTAAQVKTLLAIAIADVSGLTAALAARVQTINGVGPDGSGNVSISAAGGALASDIARLALQVAELRGTTAGTANGFADSFSDTTGIDAANSVATYDGTLDLYKRNPDTPASTLPVNASNSAPSGGAAFRASTELNASFAAWRANDDVVDVGGGNRWVSSQTDSLGWLEIDMGAARTMTAYQLNGYVPAATNQEPDSWSLYGSNSPMGGSGGTLLDSRSNEAPWSDTSLRSYTIASPGSYRYYEWRNVTAETPPTFSSICELDATFAAVTGANLDLRSTAYTHLDGTPTKASLTVVAKPNGATINTNLIGSISRDNGTTWTDVTFVQREALSGGFNVYEALDVSLTAQPSGTSMRRRLRTTAQHPVEVTGWALYSG